MPQLWNPKTGQVFGDTEHGRVYIEAEKDRPTYISTPLQRGTEMSLTEAKAMIATPAFRDYVVVAPHGKWWPW